MKITAVKSGQRLDKYLTTETDITRSKIKKLIESGNVQVNNEIKTAHYKVMADDEIKLTIPEEKKFKKPEDIPLNKIYESKNYVMINKPPDLIVHPAPNQKEGTLLNGLQKEYKDPHIVHRLDKDTSGVIAVALDEKTALNLRKQFKDRTVKKVYVTIIEGVLEEDTGEINVPIRRSRRDPTKMSVGWSGARESVTRFKVLKRLNGATLVEVYLLSGRTHQIRVHFAYYGHPVIGDTKYGKDKLGAPRQMLHAWRISFSDPETDQRVYYEAPTPEDFNEMIKKLELGA
jgi:23S rRNA pseudouridine1911/1915/1917 synthase